MNWRDIYAIWHGPSYSQYPYFILNKNTGGFAVFISYHTQQEAEEAAEQLFNRTVEESEKIILG